MWAILLLMFLKPLTEHTARMCLAQNPRRDKLVERAVSYSFLSGLPCTELQCPPVFTANISVPILSMDLLLSRLPITSDHQSHKHAWVKKTFERIAKNAHGYLASGAVR